MRFRNRVLAAVLFVLFISVNITAQIPGGGGEANRNLKTNPELLADWQNMRFGMFIHWGPVSLRGTEIGWSRGPQVPIAEYDNLYKEFNPVLFNAKEWVSAAKAAGMKYIVIVSKHHDGFTMFDSKFTDYKITNTPFKRDVLKELSDECRKQGILFCTYYSILDWHHPDYTTRYGGDPRPTANSDMNKYITYLKGQVKELVEEYRTNLFWFDGQWEKSWTHENGMDLYSYIRNLNDKVLINNRVDKGSVYYRDKDSKYAGDFDTPEQQIGEYNPDVPWESCITMCTQWSWKPNDVMKSLKACISTLVRTAGGGGNLLFNVGPMMDGRIEQRQIERLKEMGDWLKQYGSSIYGTKGGPFKPNTWLASTNRENNIYIHLLSWPKDELRLPSIPERRIINVSLMGGEKLEWSQSGSEVIIKLPPMPLNEICSVLTIELDKPVSGIKALEVKQNIFSGLQPENIKLKNNLNEKYAGDGITTLADKMRGSDSYTDGRWLGFEGEDFEAVIDLSVPRPITKVAAGFLEDQNSWIFFPKSMEVLVSDDGKEFTSAGKIVKGEPKETFEPSADDYEIKLDSIFTRFIKIKAEGVKICPQWHKGEGGKAWIFIDEINVK